MKLSHKLILGLIAGLLLIWIAGYAIVTTSKKTLEEHFLQNAGILSRDILTDIEKDINTRIEVFREYSRGTILQNTLRRSNDLFSGMKDLEGFVHQKDLEWTGIPKGETTPFMKDLIANELSVELREKALYYEKKNGYPVFSEVFVTNKYGVVTGLTERTSDYRQDDEEWWQSARRDGLFIGEIKFDESANDHAMDICMRIDSEDGDFLGIIKVLLSLNDIKRSLDDLKTSIQKESGQDSVLRLFIDDEKLVYSSMREDTLSSRASPYLPSDVVKDLHRGKEVTARQGDIVSFYVHSGMDGESLNMNFILMTQYNTKEVFAPLVNLNRNMLLILSVVSMIALAAGTIIAARITRSVRGLHEAALNIGKGFLQADIETDSRDEIGGLAQTFNQMRKDLLTTSTVRDRLTEELQENEERLRSVIDTANDAIVSFDSSGNILFWNPKAEEMFGHTADEAVGMKITAFMSELFNDFFQKEMASDIAWENTPTIGKTLEFSGFKKSGEEFPAEISLAIWKKKEETFFTAIIRDITKRRHTDDLITLQFKRLNVLHSIEKAVNSSLDLHSTLDIFTDQITTQLEIDAVTVLLMNKHTQILDHVASKGFRSGALKYTHLKIGEGNAGRAALEQRIITISNLVREPDGFVRSKLFPDEKFIVYFAVPLIAKGEVKGVLELFHRSALNADQEWLDFLETIADQAAIAIDHASLFLDLQRSRNEIINAYDSTIVGWSHALDLRDRETEGHSLRVTDITTRIAQGIGIAGDELVHIRRGALLHDIGKMGIPDSILLKPGKLTDEEWVIMRQHPEYAYNMLKDIRYLKPALDIPYYHHEKWDGTGYPKGLKGEEIPLAARIFAIVDVWDALTSDRPYRSAWSKEKTIEHIRSQAGTHFDPTLVEYFLKMA